MIRVELTVYYELLKIERQLASYVLRERKEVDYQNKLPLPRAREINMLANISYRSC